MMLWERFANLKIEVFEKLVNVFNEIGNKKKKLKLKFI